MVRVRPFQAVSAWRYNGQERGEPLLLWKTFAYQRLLQRLGISQKFSHWSSAFGFAKGLVFISTLKQKGACTYMYIYIYLFIGAP